MLSLSIFALMLCLCCVCWLLRMPSNTLYEYADQRVNFLSGLSLWLPLSAFRGDDLSVPLHAMDEYRGIWMQLFEAWNG